MRSVKAFCRLLGAGLAMAVAIPAQRRIAGPLFGDRTTVPYLLGLAVRPLLGIRVEFNGAAMKKNRHPLVYIANHLSYLDPLIFARHFPAAYVCQDGAKGWPVIGKFCESLGTIFVRRSAGFLRRLQGDMAGALNEGRDVAVFPEGHVSDGHDVLPFFSRRAERIV